MIDYVLMTTHTPRLFYVGHSQGTTALLVWLSSRPEYNQKIIQAHLFAPAAFMKHIPHPLASTLIAEVRNNFFGNYRWVSIGAILEFGNQVTRFLCTERQKATLALCQSVIFAIVGPNRHGIELDTVRRNVLIMSQWKCVKLLIAENIENFDATYLAENQREAVDTLRAINCERKIQKIWLQVGKSCSVQLNNPTWLWACEHCFTCLHLLCAWGRAGLG